MGNGKLTEHAQKLQRCEHPFHTPESLSSMNLQFCSRENQLLQDFHTLLFKVENYNFYSFFNFTMAKDSSLLDWYTFLENKYFPDQLQEAVSIVLILYSVLLN